MKLVIVESPSKAKTINKYLGTDFEVTATIGHIRDLPKSTLGVDIENGFKPIIKTLPNKKEVVEKIKKLTQKAKEIYIATDPDREGEAIAEDIAEVITEKNNTTAPIKRVLFKEITKDAVNNAIQNPLDIDKNLVESQRARRVLDRIIGYKVSPFLWEKFLNIKDNQSLSAGRVQSVALRIICEREEEINNFKPVDYFNIFATFNGDISKSLTTKLYSVDGKEIKILPQPIDEFKDINKFTEKYFPIYNQEIADKVINEIKSFNDYKILDVKKRQQNRAPNPAFITSTLQSEASKVLKFRPADTMKYAQQLYEGVELGNEGAVGLITYMRTDSTRISEEFQEKAKEYIIENYGKEYAEKSEGKKKKSAAKVQDAHEAIRPTNLKYTPEFVKPYLDKKLYKLYELIWNRFIASQMSDAKLEITTVKVGNQKFIFTASGTVIKFNGFLRLYDEMKEDTNTDDENENNNILPTGLEKDKTLNLLESNYKASQTKPPARFSESTLIKELEANGIGRPSTYATIISTIQKRNYVELKDGKLFPTELGIKVNKELIKNLDSIFNVKFTAEMEKELDEVAEGKLSYNQVLTNFYQPFIKTLESMNDNKDKIYCEKCGSEMILKKGRFGQFLACSNYPNCQNIKSLKEFQKSAVPEEPEYTGETCPECSGRLIIRKSKFGKFIGCENYPKCKYTKQLTLGIKCPKCGNGEVIEKYSKNKKLFYSCSNYPNCDFVSWYKPINENCPKGDSNYLIYKKTKTSELKECPVCRTKIVIENNETTENG
ncbi:MAG TPA: type I DNA topoisomerase [Ignavibacteriales bacterium]|nr:type I DNA topoisomerase [Ignavibacteriales bacterium]HOL80629.1 type I DNA topoisomerase [Ignavibacteriales bacterium]HOM64317.1 type I DNA topoisomerase [Ignavibacteriales bacterium]HPD68023.1 type I DNA topoisomerase [Ignavibacteriales bacterium]HPP33037.1 type I DNA topoisomerase [Ignavibacteriales bacterium]